MNRPQSYANHRRLPPLYLAAGVVLLVELGHLIWLALKSPSFWSAWAALTGAALVLVWYASRRCAQIVQDRVIRLEIRLRLERVLSPEQRLDIRRLSVPQLVALRFASDAELPALFDEILAGRLTEREEIKRSVRDWQADWLRV